MFQKLSQNLNKRIFSALILAPLVLLIIFIGGFPFYLLVIFAAVMMAQEWFDMLKNKKDMTEKSYQKYRVIGLVYVIVPTALFLHLRSFEHGFELILYLLFLVWATDIAAYFVGKALGGPKLAEKISPNKTVSGACGGMLAATIIGFLTFFITSEVSFFSFIFAAGFVSVISQIGDLFESYIKRKFEVKDSGNLIPGHGGLLDRLDGLLFAIPFFLLVNYNNLPVLFA